MNALADRIKEHARGRWHEILPAVTGLSAVYFDSNYHPCPICQNGKDRFRFTNMDGDGSVICSQCCKTAGDGISSVMAIMNKNFMEATTILQKHLGIHASQGHRKTVKRKGDYRVLIERWLEKFKPGISVEAVLRNGGEVQGVTDQGKVIDCLAIPVRGEDRITGYVWYPLNGQPLHDKDGREMKVKLRPGTTAGWIGNYGLEQIKKGEAQVIFKCEGITDMLALDTILDNPRHVAITNHAGAGALLPREQLEILRGKKVVILHDNDEAGRKGAAKWGKTACGFAHKTFLLFPPGEGEDIRDWICRQGADREETRKKFFELVRACPELNYNDVEHGARDPNEKDPDETPLSPEEPLSMAEEFIRRNNIIFWGETPYVRTTEGVWQPFTLKELKAQVQHFLKFHTEDVYSEACKGSSPKKMRVTAKLVTEVASLIEGMRQCHNEFTRTESLLVFPKGRTRALIRSEPSIQNLVIMENGLLDLDGWLNNMEIVLRKPDRNWFTIRRLEFPFVAEAGKKTRPIFEQFLEEQIPDEGMRLALQEFAGLLLLASRQGWHQFLYLWGAARSGKSSIAAVLTALCGGKNSVSTVNVGDFDNPFSLGYTLGSVLNISEEHRKITPDAEEKIKQFTGSSNITFYVKYKSPIIATPTARLMIIGNPPPTFTEESEAIWTRMIPVELPHEIPIDKRRRGMEEPETWLRSGEMPSIFNWGLGGLTRLMHNGHFTRSDYMERKAQESKDFSRPETYFFEQNLSREADVTATAQDVYNTYHNWCLMTGNQPMSQQGLTRRMLEYYGKDIERCREPARKRSYYFRGIRLLPLTGSPPPGTPPLRFVSGQSPHSS